MLKDSEFDVYKNYTDVASKYLISVKILENDFESNSSINSKYTYKGKIFLFLKKYFL